MGGRSLIRIGGLAVAVALAGCNNKPRSAGTEAAPSDQVTSSAAAGETKPFPGPAVARSASEPATGRPVPASLPTSTYDSTPPYPVRIFVRSPEDEQPGWLRILSLIDPKAAAACSGQFAVKNQIEVTTDNVRQIRIHISHLPLAERKRIILRIDDQPIELARKNRDYVILERRTTGEWNVAKSLP
ncbi:MAG TPA: hypothetical protein PKY77_12015 [Phycisphaerae bacterium]|nr:hypothetical protein [Phycisphaerae bacterium]HRY69313.1 hypothetical protein [Phycisphaerae bacterium]HSA26631.1 hypothetical protein [Phycisphaerae bacterium]